MTDRQAMTGTYRLQIRPEFGFTDAAAQVDYLRDLGISHIYLSPILTAAPGSPHGYDVVDHTSLSAEAGGRGGFDQLVEALRRNAIGAIADVVPNHVCLPTPAYLNAQLWDLLRHGTDSRYAAWFDVDWEAGEDTILMPVLGEALEQALEDGLVVLDPKGGPTGEDLVLRYHEHEFPVRPGTEDLPLEHLVQRQWYRLSHWQAADLGLNYRRFFDVKTLVAVRVEDPAVFAATHELLIRLVREGALDGLRIDHPDGLADPRGYLRMLAEATADTWVVVEKILEGEEHLPEDWPIAGTTGYDALKRAGGVFVDPAGSDPLLALLAVLVGQVVTPAQVAIDAKMQVGLRVQAAEVRRLVRLLVAGCQRSPDGEELRPEALRRALSALLVSMDRYRAYVHPGERPTEESALVLHQAADRARRLVAASDRPVVNLVRDVALGRPPERRTRAAVAAREEFVVRYQQTCGPIQAKGIEDTAFYRWFHLTALNEVGGNPGEFGISTQELHRFAERILADWPQTLTALSTHDTKRSEDTRARLVPLSELPVEWSAWMHTASGLARDVRPPLLDPATEYLLWQTLVATWPISAERLKTYAHKAVREACVHTSWVEPDAAYEAAVEAFIDWALTDPRVEDHVAVWLGRTVEHVRAATLGQKLVQLVMPGIPDLYQGSELVECTLVDPDNRRPVDYVARRRRLAALDAGAEPRDLSDEKLLVTSRAMRLRRDHPDWFGAGSTYRPVASTSPNALTIGRGRPDGLDVVAVATRLPESLALSGGWGEHSVGIPPGRWRDLLAGTAIDTDKEGVLVRRLLASLPVALLVRDA
ncbi:MAG: malto-oligosyltrehalose synthase [Dermatophilaceae bacterium]